MVNPPLPPVRLRRLQSVIDDLLGFSHHGVQMGLVFKAFGVDFVDVLRTGRLLGKQQSEIGTDSGLAGNQQVAAALFQ
jgi:hypothetical protein